MLRFVLSLIYRGQARDARIDNWNGIAWCNYAP